MEYTLQYFAGEDSFPFFIQYGRHNDSLEMHTHGDFTELTIVLSGEATHVVAEETFPIKKGDVFVLRGDVEHGYVSPHNFRISNIMFQEDKFAFRDMDVFKTMGYQALFQIEPEYAGSHGFNSRMFLSEESFHKVEALLRPMVTEYAEKKPGYRSMLTAGFYYLVTLLSREYPLHNKKEEKHSDILALAKTVAYMEQHYMEAVSIQSMADYSGYSRRHFTRLFQDVYHVAPLDYVISLRLESAARKLRETEDNIGDIATKCGFENVNYFYRLFRQKMGMTPGKYRRSL